MSDRPTWDDMSSTEREALIRAKLATIRKAWPILLDPPASHGVRRPPPGSRIPMNSDALSLRAEIGHDAAFWLRRLLEDNTAAMGEAERVDAADTLVVLGVLLRNAKWMSGWTFGKRMAFEMSDHAFDASVIAWPRDRGTYLLGPCPNTIGVEGQAVECGTKVRAAPGDASDIKCRGCGLTDTFDGWVLRMVGTEKPVTIPILRGLLHKQLGISTDERTLRRWHRAGRIPSCGGTDGKPLFDRRQVMAALMAEEEAKRRHALT